MAGSTTTQAFPYPYITEAATPVSVQNLANQVDTKLTAKDASRTAALQKPNAQIRRPSVAQNITLNTMTVLTFTSEDWDIGGLANVPTVNDRFTIVTAGLYEVNGFVQINGAAQTTTIVELQVTRNGTAVIRNRERQSTTGWTGSEDRWITVSGVLLLAAADAIRLAAYWAGAGGPYGAQGTRFSIRLLSV